MLLYIRKGKERSVMDITRGELVERELDVMIAHQAKRGGGVIPIG
jgi:hypothetical protein